MLPFGLSSTGFMSDTGSRPHASAWTTCARPISPPSRQGYEFSDMFCALNGATRTPRRLSVRERPVATPPAGGGRMQLHFLRLERPHAPAAPPERAADRRRHEALAHVRRCS